MTPADLLAWRQRMGYSHQEAADALGIAKNTYQEMERGADFKTGKPRPIDRRTDLACAALEAGLTGISG